jgi:hypothetical protein
MSLKAILRARLTIPFRTVFDSQVGAVIPLRVFVPSASASAQLIFLRFVTLKLSASAAQVGRAFRHSASAGSATPFTVAVTDSNDRRCVTSLTTSRPPSVIFVLTL